MKTKITCEEAVRMLQELRISSPASKIAEAMSTDSRAVATALRKATRDGRVTITYRRGIGWYRFIRITPRNE